MLEVDLDRGMEIHSHPSTGMDVFMYVDDPGVYLSAHGTPVSEQLAEQAGFDIERFGRERRIKQALAAAHKQIMDDFNANGGGPKIIEEREGFKVVDIGMDRHQVMSPDGKVLNTVPLSLANAKILLEHLVVVDKEEKGEAE